MAIIRRPGAPTAYPNVAGTDHPIDPHCISISKRAPLGSVIPMPLNQESPVSAITVVSAVMRAWTCRKISVRTSFPSGLAECSGCGCARMRWYSTIVAFRFCTWRARPDRKSRRWMRPKSCPSQVDTVLVRRQHAGTARHRGPADDRVIVEDRADADHAVRPVKDLARAGGAHF